MSDFFGGINIMRKRTGGGNSTPGESIKKYFPTTFTGNFSITDAMFGMTVFANETLTVTVQTGLRDGFWCIVENVGTGEVTFAQGVGVVLNRAGQKLVTQYTSAVVEKQIDPVHKVEGQLTT